MSSATHSSMFRGAVLVEALIDRGVQDIVLAPGSRSAPLALALARAERQGRLRLHVRIDERSAGFLALGLAKGSGRPAAVVTTSGTAAVNLHPAVVEASYGGVPLIAVTADRPERLRGVGANQTILQADLFGSECRFSVDLTVADAGADVSAVDLAVRAATDAAHPGPVQINIALDEPLVDEDDVEDRAREFVSAVGAASADEEATGRPRWPLGSPVSGRGLIIVGDTCGFPQAAADPRLIEELSRATGWPIISEPSGNASNLDGSLLHGPLIAADRSFSGAHQPEVVLTIGRVGLHRSVMALIRGAGQHVVVDPRPEGYRCDPLRTAVSFLPAIPVIDSGAVAPDSEWRADWEGAQSAWVRHLDEVVEAAAELDGVRVSRDVVAELRDGDVLVVGPSWPVRHVSAFAGATGARILANRGTSGIDGVISTAWGVASVVPGFTVALLGDLTALYDRNGLLAAPGEAHPHLAYVVIDNDGGGIFGELEQGASNFAVDFERVFGTPHGADLVELLSAPGITMCRAESVEDLRTQLEWARSENGVRVIVVSGADRRGQVERIARISERE